MKTSCNPTLDFSSGLLTGALQKVSSLLLLIDPHQRKTYMELTTQISLLHRPGSMVCVKVMTMLSFSNT